MLCLPAACRAMPCQSELLLVSDYSGCTDQNRPSVNAAGVGSYLRDRMSLSVRHYPLCACCWVAWCSRQTDERRRGSIQGEADVGLLKATSGAPAT